MSLSIYAWNILSPEQTLNSQSSIPFLTPAQVAKIETERLLAQMVRAELDRLSAAGQYTGTFLPQVCGGSVGRSVGHQTNQRMAPETKQCMFPIPSR